MDIFTPIEKLKNVGPRNLPKLNRLGIKTVKDLLWHFPARYDDYTPSTLDRGLDMSLVIAGFDWAPYNKSWKIQPNVWFYNYTDGPRYNASAAKNTDLMFNLTFFLSF